jgi:hypothetical protein
VSPRPSPLLRTSSCFQTHGGSSSKLILTRLEISGRDPKQGSKLSTFHDRVCSSNQDRPIPSSSLGPTRSPQTDLLLRPVALQIQPTSTAASRLPSFSVHTTETDASGGRLGERERERESLRCRCWPAGHEPSSRQPMHARSCRTWLRGPEPKRVAGRTQKAAARIGA